MRLLLLTALTEQKWSGEVGANAIETSGFLACIVNSGVCAFRNRHRLQGCAAVNSNPGDTHAHNDHIGAMQRQFIIIILFLFHDLGCRCLNMSETVLGNLDILD